MKRCFLIIVGLVAVLAGPVAAQTPVGVNATVENSVQTRSVGESGWRPSIVDGTVRLADAIVTGADSRLLIRLRDQSVLTVGANAALNVDRFVIDAEADPAGVLFSMVRGAFRFVSGSRSAERERVAFRTPTATIGIRGTVIEAAVGTDALELLDGEAGTPGLADDPDLAAVIVLVEGEIEIEVDGVRRIISEPGQAVAVSGRRVSEPFRLSPEAGRRLADRLPPREPGGPGAGPQGQRPEGQGPGGQPPQGQPSQGQGAQGSGPQGQGQAPQGQAPQGQTPQSEASKGQTPQGQAPQGRGPRGQGDRGATTRPGSAGSGQSPGPGAGPRPG
ncbi:FecR family protein [Brevundimonas sp.]|uniref:FecR family protein n=1 Tax=Brevundimonas sp. TaxID=1871086 RepID=UPI003F70FFFE